MREPWLAVTAWLFTSSRPSHWQDFSGRSFCCRETVPEYWNKYATFDVWNREPSLGRIRMILSQRFSEANELRRRSLFYGNVFVCESSSQDISCQSPFLRIERWNTRLKKSPIFPRIPLLPVGMPHIKWCLTIKGNQNPWRIPYPMMRRCECGEFSILNFWNAGKQSVWPPAHIKPSFRQKQSKAN